MSDETTKWFAGWYATRLHCVSVANLGGTDNAGRAMCGQLVYEKPKTKYAARLLAKGVKRCKHCERLYAEFSGAGKQGETGQSVLSDAEQADLQTWLAECLRQCSTATEGGNEELAERWQGRATRAAAMLERLGGAR